MVNLLCNFRKISYDKCTKSAMASQVKHKGLAELRGAEGAYHLLHISTGIEAKSIPLNDLLILLTPPRFSVLQPSLTCNALVDLDRYLVFIITFMEFDNLVSNFDKFMEFDNLVSNFVKSRNHWKSIC